jgi:hypothetical protein
VKQKSQKKAKLVKIPNGKARKPRSAVAPAAPTIQSPGANTYAAPGVNLSVEVWTNRPDLSYIVTLADITSGSTLPPPPVNLVIPAPCSIPFFAVFNGSNLVANRLYTLRVFVNPASGLTPPHMDHTINVHTSLAKNCVIVTESSFEGYHTDDE